MSRKSFIYFFCFLMSLQPLQQIVGRSFRTGVGPLAKLPQLAQEAEEA
jgi:hypothetical protein